ncbi:MAG TPA: helix-turn-helix transcriptional regulator [Myxococcaceae bacterium]|nr:helix-turn-helix transcriptional regulator [Myxococcaceae bacterium]
MDYADFGRYLAQQRELRGVSRADVASATKIPANLIAALETGQVERLPERVFIVNYIRAYAQVIGMESQEAVLRFEEIDKRVHTERNGAKPVGPSHLPRPVWLAVGIALLLLLVIAVLAFKGVLPPRRA